MKRNVLAIALSLLMLISLTACGSAKTEQSWSSSTVESPAEAPEGSFDASYSEDSANIKDAAGALADQKLIYTANLNLETTTFEDAVKALTELTDACGGYFEDSTIGNRGSGYSWANYTIRVPANQFQNFLNQAGEVAHLTWCNTNQENITEVYYDTQGRLESQKIKLERLQELLRKAENMEDIITIESAISETEWQIENLSGTMRHYDALVDYATVHVDLNEVYKLSNTETAPLTFGERMRNALTEGLRSFGSGMEDLAVALAYSWLWLLLLAVIVAVIVCVVRKQHRKRKAKKAAQSNQSDQTEEK